MDDSEDPSIAETSANAAAGLIPATRQKLINAAGSFSFTSFLSSIRPLNQYPFALQGATSAQLGNEIATEPNSRLDFTQYVVELHFLLTKFSFPLPIKKQPTPQSRPINLSAIAKSPARAALKALVLPMGPQTFPSRAIRAPAFGRASHRPLTLQSDALHVGTDRAPHTRPHPHASERARLLQALSGRGARRRKRRETLCQDEATLNRFSRPAARGEEGGGASRHLASGRRIMRNIAVAKARPSHPHRRRQAVRRGTCPRPGSGRGCCPAR